MSIRQPLTVVRCPLQGGAGVPVSWCEGVPDQLLRCPCHRATGPEGVDCSYPKFYRDKDGKKPADRRNGPAPSASNGHELTAGNLFHVQVARPDLAPPQWADAQRNL